MSSSRSILIRGGRVLRMVAGTIPAEERLDLLVKDGRIAAMDPHIESDEAELIDADGQIVMPGFVDTHRHTWQTPLRTVATDWSLVDYIADMRCIHAAFFSPEDVYLANYIGALEAVNAGITSLVDHCHIINSVEHAEEAARGLQDSGIRGVFCYGFWPNPTGFEPMTVVPGEAWRFEAARALRRGRLSSDGDRIRFGVAPSELEAMPPDLTSAEIALARELGATCISMHVAMGGYDQGHHAVQWLHQRGLLANDMLFVHGSALTDGELALIRDAGAGLSATPETELQMGMGIPVITRALAANVRASLGIDIVSNYSGDMFSQMRLGLQVMRSQVNQGYLERGKAPQNIRPTAAEYLHLATHGGAQAAGLDGITGSLEVGKRADIVLLRTDTINMTPSTNAVGAVVLNAGLGDVDTVVVDGRVIKRHGRLVNVDWAKLSRQLKASAERILEKSAAVNAAPVHGFARSLFPNVEA